MADRKDWHTGFCAGVCASLTVVLAMGDDVTAEEIVGACAKIPDLIRACDKDDDVVLKFLRHEQRRLRERRRAAATQETR